MPYKFEDFERELETRIATNPAIKLWPPFPEPDWPPCKDFPPNFPEFSTVEVSSRDCWCELVRDILEKAGVIDKD